MRGMNKKGGETTIATVIAIALGVVVLVFLIFGFSTGWTNLWDKVVNIGGGSANLGTIKQSCDIACSSHDTENYCNFERTVKFGKDVNVTEYCNDTSTTTDRNNCYATCFELSESDVKEVQAIGVSQCPSLC